MPVNWATNALTGQALCKSVAGRPPRARGLAEQTELAAETSTGLVPHLGVARVLPILSHSDQAGGGLTQQESCHMKRIAALLATTALALGAVSAAQAQELTKVTFGTNWLAQPEHGGFYQSVADGTYAACGLEVTIAPGGPQVNNRALLLAGKIQFNMGGNMMEAFSAVKEGIPLRVVAASFQKEPQVLMTHPGQGLDTWEQLINAEQFILGDQGFQSYFQWMITEFGYDGAKRIPYTFNPAAFIAQVGAAMLYHFGTVCR
jgi:hypothetical protein